MHRLLKILVPFAVLLLVVGCNSRTDKADSGGVVLQVSRATLPPAEISVTLAMQSGFVVLNSITVEAFATDPNVDSSLLQTVELETYEVTYTRNDSGTRVPVPMVRAIGGAVDEGGSIIFTNQEVLTREQLDNPPLSDLQAVNGGIDRETGSDSIVMNISLRFFGRTVAGNRVASNAFSFTQNFVP